MEFGRKHLPDRFYLERDQRKSLRNIITREMIANTLIHREYTSTYQAKFVIEKSRMYIENANRAFQDAVFTSDCTEPHPKNPIIADFFRNIGYADKLGSGVRNLYKYSKIYSGKDPEFIEGDVFKIIVPLNEDLINESLGQIDTQANTQAASIDTQAVSNDTQAASIDTQAVSNDTQAAPIDTQVDTQDNITMILSYIKSNPTASQPKIAKELGININSLKGTIRKLRKAGKIEREGTSQKGKWIVK